MNPRNLLEIVVPGGIEVVRREYEGPVWLALTNATIININGKREGLDLAHHR